MATENNVDDYSREQTTASQCTRSRRQTLDRKILPCPGTAGSVQKNVRDNLLVKTKHKHLTNFGKRKRKKECDRARERDKGERRGGGEREGRSCHHIMHAFDFLAADATKERPKEKRKEEERKKSEMK